MTGISRFACSRVMLLARARPRIQRPLCYLAALVLPMLCLPGCKTSPARIRVLTYNIRHGEGTDGKLDLPRTAAVIRNANPDLVALQEVDDRTKRTGLVDQTAELGRLTSLQAAFGKAFDYAGGRYGAAVLSRWPFEQVTPQVLPGSSGHEIRPALMATVRPGRRQPELCLVSTHLDHQSESERIAQVKRLFELLAPGGTKPVIVAGDLNSLPTSPVLKLFTAEWANATAGQERFTIPSEQPRRQIDYVLCRPAERWRVAETQVFPGPASDHCALLVVLELIR